MGGFLLLLKQTSPIWIPVLAAWVYQYQRKKKELEENDGD